jgi:molybdenum cofactor synthesis domain-containing protein
MHVEVGILTVSDRAAAGHYDDVSGPRIGEILRAETDWSVARQQVVPDELDAIVQVLTDWAGAGLDLILTTGGTGFAPRDVTPEATLAVIDRSAPGIAEALRADSLKITRHAMLSRAVAGLRGHCLIINLPGNPQAIGESLAILLPVLPHALDLLNPGSPSDTAHRAA